METATRGGGDNNKTVQKCVKKFARVVKWEKLLQKRNTSDKCRNAGTQEDIVVGSAVGNKEPC